MQEAFGLLGAVVFDEVDGRAFAIDGDGAGQVEIVADGGLSEIAGMFSTLVFLASISAA